MRKTPDFVKYAAGIVPDERQLKWQELGFNALVSYGMNTYTNSEWGNGNEDPELFAPTALDCRQWAKLCKLSGIKGLILTVKHQDGFCLWPSAYTDHCVSASKWKDGKGDVVAECAAACREFGIKFGVYLSIWDRHEETYGTSAYDDFFKNLLRELLTAYGDIFCVWLDNTGCGDSVRDHDMEGWVKLIRELQPNAVIAGCGCDVRWCGNEVGVCRRSEWSVVPYYYSDLEAARLADQADVSKPPKKINSAALDLGSRKAIKACSRLIWYPAEVNMPLRKGWFYHPDDDYNVKPLSKIAEVYYRSVGANASFLLGIAPNPEGKIHEKDVETLLSVGAQLEIDFNEDLAADSVVTDSRHLDDKHSGQKALSDYPGEYWHSGDDPDGAELVLDLGDEYDIDKILLAEHIATGQQIEEFSIYVKLGGKWKKLANETVVGHCRICRFKEVRAQHFKIVIEKARCFATLERLEAY